LTGRSPMAISANEIASRTGGNHALRLGFRDPWQIQPSVLGRPRLDDGVYDRHRHSRHFARARRRNPAPEPLVSDRFAPGRLYRAVSLHAATRADHLVLLRLSGATGAEHPGPCRRDERALALWRRVLCRNRSRRHRERAARTMGCGAGAWLAAMAHAAAGHPAPSAQADVAALRQSVGDPVEEHLAGLGHRGLGPRL